MFAGPISSLFGVSLDTPLASERIDGLNNTLPKPEMGPPNGPFTGTTRWASRPAPARTTWPTGCTAAACPSMIATAAALFASTVGVVIGLLAGFLGGAVDKVLSFFIDMFLTIPFLLAALTLAPILNERFNPPTTTGRSRSSAWWSSCRSSAGWAPRA